jgi:prephenate dehydratase
MAARALYGPDLIPLQTTRFREIFEHITHGRADVGVVPIENALAGSVHENYDLMQEYQCFVIDEYYCPVHLHLMGTGPASAITRAFSHPKALEQCSTFLESNPQITAVVCSDTAGAALQVAESKDPTNAAIASEEAAQVHGLPIIQRSIQNHKTNATRFIAIAAHAAQCGSPTKSSIVVSLPHQPGSLHKLLGLIAELDINLTKIESRPVAGKPFEYAFHIDIACNEGESERLIQAVSRVHNYARDFRQLGLYRSRSPIF